MRDHHYATSLTELAPGAYAYVVGTGTWNQSNSGLVTSRGESLIVDTLMTLGLTSRMLSAYGEADPAATHVDMVVNTHADGDHTWGNQLVADGRIIATEATLDDLKHLPTPQQANAMAPNLAELGSTGRFLERFVAGLDFAGAELTCPNETFRGSLELTVGDKDVELIQVGPAHSNGDLVVHVPSDGVIYVGDILFTSGHPAVWSGPYQNWIDACRTIEALDVDVVVPGHGALSDRAGVARQRGYLEYVRDQAGAFHQKGLSLGEAAHAFDLGPYAGWSDPERILINIDAVYRELEDGRTPDKLDLFGQIADLLDEADTGRTVPWSR
jgi:cyclase